MVFGVSGALNLEEVPPVMPELVAFKLSICNELPPVLASPEESFSTLSGAPTQAIAAIKINKPNSNNHFPIIDRTAIVSDGFSG